MYQNMAMTYLFKHTIRTVWVSGELAELIACLHRDQACAEVKGEGRECKWVDFEVKRTNWTMEVRKGRRAKQPFGKWSRLLPKTTWTMCSTLCLCLWTVCQNGWDKSGPAGPCFNTVAHL